MTEKPRKALLVNIAWATALALLLAVAYVASYPIVLRFGPPQWMRHTPGYGPVEWLVDETPLQRPILWWSEICGTEFNVSVGNLVRCGPPPIP